MPDSLAEWLAHVERVHTRPIDLGLERVQRVKTALGFTQSVPLITVAGTNGKGSTCAMLERILLCAGYRVGLYSSPHLLAYNERVRINGTPVADPFLCAGFAAVESVREATPLTYFEFGTLCAWHVFAAHALDLVILEVGMGGRLDAVNVFDTDCAVVTSIDLDHMEFLGDTREKIGREKAGIFRAAKPAVVADPAPPQSVWEYGVQIGAALRVSGRDFGFDGDRSQWQYWSRRADSSKPGSAPRRTGGLAYPALRGANQLLNAAGAIAALEALEESLPVSMQHVRRGLIEVDLPGRFQVLPGRPTVILDVAHNPQAVAVLADNLGNMGFFPETWAIFGMLRDKDIANVIERVRHRVDHWLLCSLPGPRGAASAELAAQLAQRGVGGDVRAFDTPAQAYGYAREHATQDDRICAFGSFLTVADVMRAIQSAQSQGNAE